MFTTTGKITTCVTMRRTCETIIQLTPQYLHKIFYVQNKYSQYSTKSTLYIKQSPHSNTLVDIKTEILEHCTYFVNSIIQINQYSNYTLELDQ